VLSKVNKNSASISHLLSLCNLLQTETRLCKIFIRKMKYSYKKEKSKKEDRTVYRCGSLWREMYPTCESYIPPEPKIIKPPTESHGFKMKMPKPDPPTKTTSKIANNASTIVLIFGMLMLLCFAIAGIIHIRRWWIKRSQERRRRNIINNLEVINQTNTNYYCRQYKKKNIITV
jgi:hypothetical protein